MNAISDSNIFNQLNKSNFLSENYIKAHKTPFGHDLSLDEDEDDLNKSNLTQGRKRNRSKEERDKTTEQIEDLKISQGELTKFVLNLVPIVNKINADINYFQQNLRNHLILNDLKLKKMAPTPNKDINIEPAQGMNEQKEVQNKEIESIEIKENTQKESDKKTMDKSRKPGANKKFIKRKKKKDKEHMEVDDQNEAPIQENQEEDDEKYPVVDWDKEERDQLEKEKLKTDVNVEEIKEEQNIAINEEENKEENKEELIKEENNMLKIDDLKDVTLDKLKEESLNIKSSQIYNSWNLLDLKDLNQSAAILAGHLNDSISRKIVKNETFNPETLSKSCDFWVKKNIDNIKEDMKLEIENLIKNQIINQMNNLKFEIENSITNQTNNELKNNQNIVKNLIKELNLEKQISEIQQMKKIFNEEFQTIKDKFKDYQIESNNWFDKFKKLYEEENEKISKVRNETNVMLKNLDKERENYQNEIKKEFEKDILNLCSFQEQQQKYNTDLKNNYEEFVKKITEIDTEINNMKKNNENIVMIQNTLQDNINKIWMKDSNNLEQNKAIELQRQIEIWNSNLKNMKENHELTISIEYLEKEVQSCKKDIINLKNIDILDIRKNDGSTNDSIVKVQGELNQLKLEYKNIEKELNDLDKQIKDYNIDNNKFKEDWRFKCLELDKKLDYNIKKEDWNLEDIEKNIKKVLNKEYNMKDNNIHNMYNDLSKEIEFIKKEMEINVKYLNEKIKENLKNEANKDKILENKIEFKPELKQEFNPKIKINLEDFYKKKEEKLFEKGINKFKGDVNVIMKDIEVQIQGLKTKIIDNENLFKKLEKTIDDNNLRLNDKLKNNNLKISLIEDNFSKLNIKVLTNEKNINKSELIHNNLENKINKQRDDIFENKRNINNWTIKIDNFKNDIFIKELENKINNLERSLKNSDFKFEDNLKFEINNLNNNIEISNKKIENDFKIEINSWNSKFESKIQELNNLIDKREFKTEIEKINNKFNEKLQDLEKIIKELPKYSNENNKIEITHDNNKENKGKNNKKDKNNKDDSKKKRNTWGDNDKEQAEILSQLLNDNDNKYCTAENCKYCREIENQLIELQSKCIDFETKINDNIVSIEKIKENTNSMDKLLNDKILIDLIELKKNNDLGNVNNDINTNSCKEMLDKDNITNVINNINLKKLEISPIKNNNNLNINFNKDIVQYNKEIVITNIMKKIKKYWKFLGSEDGINLQKRRGISKISLDTFISYKDLTIVKKKKRFDKQKYHKINNYNKNRNRYNIRVIDKSIWKLMMNFTLEDNKINKNLKFSYRFDNKDNIVVIDEINNKEIKKICRYCFDTHEGELCPNILLFMNINKIKWNEKIAKEICPICGYSHNVFKIRKKQCDILLRIIGLALLLNSNGFNEKEKVFINEDKEVLKTIEELLKLILLNQSKLNEENKLQNIWYKNRKLSSFILENYHNFIVDKNIYYKKMNFNINQIGQSNGKFKNNIDDIIIFLKQITNMFYEKEYQNSKQKITDELLKKKNININNKFIFSIINKQSVLYKENKYIKRLDRKILNTLFWNIINIEVSNRLLKRLENNKKINIIWNMDNNIIKRTFNRNILIKKIKSKKLLRNPSCIILLAEINDLLELRKINNNGEEKRYQTKYINKLCRKYENLLNPRLLIPTRREYYLSKDLTDKDNFESNNDSSGSEISEDLNLNIGDKVKNDLNKFNKKEPRKDKIKKIIKKEEEEIDQEEEEEEDDDNENEINDQEKEKEKEEEEKKEEKKDNIDKAKMDKEEIKEEDNNIDNDKDDLY